MGWLKEIFSPYRSSEKGNGGKRRSIAQIATNRLTPSDWRTLTPLEQLLTSNYVIRERARDLEKTNDFAERFLAEFEGNVPGPNGFTFQSCVRELQQQPDKKWKWVDDTVANNKIEEAVREFSLAQNYTVTGQFTRAEAETLIARMWARDGEVFVRKVPMADAKFGMKLQILEAERCDEMLNTVNKENGNIIKMGVEIDKWRRPVAYWFRKESTSSELWGAILYAGGHDRIEAQYIDHLFYQKYPNQTRGISLLVQSMVRMKRLSDYENAVLINAEISAKKMGFFSDKLPEDPQEMLVGTKQTETDAQGNEYETGDQVMKVEAGSFEDIGAKEFHQFAPDFPTAQHKDFFTTTAKTFSAGLIAPYSSLTNDLGEATYSSERSGKMTINEMWKLRQMRFVNRFSMPSFSTFLQFGILAGAVNLPMSKIEKFNKPFFIGRRWGLIDPLKDVMADALRVEYGFTTRTQILAENGYDIEEINAELAKEQQDAEAAGIKLKFNLEVPQAAALDEQEEEKKPADGAAKKKEREEDELITLALELLMKKRRNGHTHEKATV